MNEMADPTPLGDILIGDNYFPWCYRKVIPNRKLLAGDSFKEILLARCSNETFGKMLGR